VIPVYSFTRVRSTNPKCTRGCGCNGHPAFPAPSVFIGRKLHTQLGRIAPRGREAASGFGVIASEAKQSILPSRGEMDCFAARAMTAPHLDRLCCLKLEPRHCEERSDEAIHSFVLARRDGLLRGPCHRARIRATRWLAMTAPHLDRLCCLKLESRHCEERSDEAIHSFFARRDGLLRCARNDGPTPGSSVLFEIRAPSLRGAERRSNPYFLLREMDCFADPVIGRAFARPVGSQ
jgi:hypothetical protein